MLILLLAGNRMFSFDDNSSDFYLAQLVNIYIHMPETAEAIHPYIVHRLLQCPTVPLLEYPSKPLIVVHLKWNV